MSNHSRFSDSDDEEFSVLLPLLNVLAALFLGFGALQEFIVRGVQAQEAQPLFVSLAGIVVSLLFVVSGVALWRRWPAAERLAVLAGGASVLFHLYAALPPHRNVGPPALLVGAGYGLVLLVNGLRTVQKRRKTPRPA